MRKRVLFVVHDASRTGAPIALLRFVRWACRAAAFDLDLAVLRDGPLVPEFMKVGPTRVLRDAAELAAIDMGGYDLVYANSVASHRALERVREIPCPVVTHVFELEWELARLDAPVILENARSQRFVAASTAVARNIVANHGVLEDDIAVIRGVISHDEDRGGSNIRAEVRDALRWPPSAIVIAAAGQLGWRKGSDLFVQVARETALRASSPVRFLWIGGHPNHAVERSFAFDVENANLCETVASVGTVANPFDYLHAADIFALTSREDPLPLVCLEAALAGLPIVAFDSGGVTDLSDGFVEVVDYLDVPAFVSALTVLADSADTRRIRSERARRAAPAYDVERFGPALWAVIEDCLGEDP